jgi:glycosyltransferase involved in cell wall biosynthesis
MRSNNPLISVVMICHNHEKYIAEAISSILSQTYNNFELIVVDDGSTDKTIKIIQEFTDPRIIVLTQENSGPSVALNNGIIKSQGEYVALMSGDDVSYDHRLFTQINQIELHEADMIFSLPQIIGPNSEELDWDVCPWFFKYKFENGAQLLHILFSGGNFLCAPSCFCSRTAIAGIGQFKRGLIQLQDFDYWIRACKKKHVIKMFSDPLVKYRYLYGKNLSNNNNLNRAKTETLEIYRSFFDDMPADLFVEAFRQNNSTDISGDMLDIEIDQTYLLLSHSDVIIKALGASRMIQHLEDDQTYEKLVKERSFDLIDFFQTTNLINIDEYYGFNKIKKMFRKITDPPLSVSLSKEKAEKKIIEFLDNGDYRKAIALASGVQMLKPEKSFSGSIKKYISIILRRLVKYSLPVYSEMQTIRKRLSTWKLDIGVYPLARMYDYCKQSNLIIYEENPEQVVLSRPEIIGESVPDLFEGLVYCPQPYVSILEDAVITGGSSLVISHEGILLNDEMVDFQGEEYGIKSPYVKFRHKDKVILSYQSRSHRKIKEGILISCDHDINYFHWMIECLPKLMFIDEMEQFKDVPLLLPKGLHDNLEKALEKVNVNDHRIIRIEPGVSFKVGRLIFPSALTRIVDRYKGKVAYDTDIVLSENWVSKVGNQLKGNITNETKPYRKIYLTRREGLRAIKDSAEIELMLLRHQFEIIDIGGTSLEHQIELFAQAAVVIAPTGAALTNMLFCPPGTKVIILMSNHELTNYYFWSQLAQIAGLDVKFIAGDRIFNVSSIFSVHDDYAIDPDVLLQEIVKMM